MINILEESCGENKNTILCSVLFFSRNRAFYEIISKSNVEPETLHMTIWRRVACWISKATRSQAHSRVREHTHTVYVRTHPRMHTQTEIRNTYCFSTTNNGFVHAPQCYVIRKLPLFLDGLWNAVIET